MSAYNGYQSGTNNYVPNSDNPNGKSTYNHPLNEAGEIYQTNPKIHEIQVEIEHVKNQMIDNVRLVVDRGERIEDLQQKTDEIAKASMDLELGARKLRKEMCWQKYKLQLIIFGVLLLFVIIVIILVILSQKN